MNKHTSFMQINHEALNSIAFGNFGGSFARVSRSSAAALRGGIALGNFGGSFARVSWDIAAAVHRLIYRLSMPFTLSTL